MYQSEILQCIVLILHKMNICKNPTTHLRWTGKLTSGGRDTQARQYSVAWGARVWKEAGNVARLADVVCSFWNQNKINNITPALTTKHGTCSSDMFCFIMKSSSVTKLGKDCT